MLKDTQIVEMLTSVSSFMVFIITVCIIPKLTSLLKSKVNNELAKNAFDDIQRNVIIGVNYIEQTFVSTLKAEGKWDAVAQQEALRQAVNVIYNNIQAATIKQFDNNIIAIQTYIKQCIEAKIAQQKSSSIIEEISEV